MLLIQVHPDDAAAKSMGMESGKSKAGMCWRRKMGQRSPWAPFEASALFSPSIVEHADQSGVPSGSKRFVLSLRAVGEGHVSSLTFRSGIVAQKGIVNIEPTARLASVPIFDNPSSTPQDHPLELTLSSEQPISEGVIFPITAAQSNGIEDPRFVEFEEAGQTTYYATYTTYSGRDTRSELPETKDFLSFRMTPLARTASKNKGMALFPRKIDDQYVMIGLQDNEPLPYPFQRPPRLGWRRDHSRS